MRHRRRWGRTYHPVEPETLVHLLAVVRDRTARLESRMNRYVEMAGRRGTGSPEEIREAVVHLRGETRLWHAACRDLALAVARSRPPGPVLSADVLSTDTLNADVLSADAGAVADEAEDYGEVGLAEPDGDEWGWRR